MKIKEYNQMMSYLTKPNRVFPSKPKQETIKKEKPKQEFDVTSNVMMNAYKYDEVDKGTEKEIRKYLIQKMDSGQQLNSDEVRFMMDTKGPEYPKEATPQQMENLKNNFNKYKETQKPFSQRKKTLRPEPVKPVTVVPDVKLKEIEDGLKALDIIHEPEPTVEEIIKERADKRLELEQKEYDQKFGTGGIAQLRRPL